MSATTMAGAVLLAAALDRLLAEPPDRWRPLAWLGRVLGKFAARAHDVLSCVPARLIALLLAPPRAWPQLRQGARATPSPIGGWPMAAIAPRLGLRLRKPGVYALCANSPSPTAAVTARAGARRARSYRRRRTGRGPWPSWCSHERGAQG